MEERVYWDLRGNRVIQEEATSWADALGSYFSLGVMPELKSLTVLKGGGFFKWLKGLGEGKAPVSELDNILGSLKPLDDLDVVTLYRGTTGSENAGSILFLTDDASVAAGYVENGGAVLKYKLSRLALKKLEYAGNLFQFVGKHGATGATNTEYKFIGATVKQAINALGRTVK